MHEAYKKEKKQRALPLAGLAAMISVRQSLDVRAETAQRPLIMSGDGSYTNKAVLRGLPPRNTLYRAHSQGINCTCRCSSKVTALPVARASMVRPRPPRSRSSRTIPSPW